MKLKTVTVRMFRNILNSTEVKIEDKVTCLVGKNESGKSAFLNALWRLNPARRTPQFSIPDHYPAWLEKRHRNEGMELNHVKPIEVELEWESTDVKALEARFGLGVTNVGTKLSLSKNYDNKFGWTSGCNEHQAVKNFVEQHGLSTDTYTAIQSFEKLTANLDEDIADKKEEPEGLKILNNAQAALKTLLGKTGTFADATWEVAHARIPQFFYFADYSKLPYMTCH